MAVSLRVRFEVFERDRFTCQYCGGKAPVVQLQLDHVVPVARGGSDKIGNLLTSCYDCNQGKRARPLPDDVAVAYTDEKPEPRRLSQWDLEEKAWEEHTLKAHRERWLPVPNDQKGTLYWSGNAGLVCAVCKPARAERAERTWQ